MAEPEQKVPLLERIFKRRAEIKEEQENERQAKEARLEEKVKQREARLKDPTLKTTYKMAAFRRTSSSKWDELLTLRDKLNLDKAAEPDRNDGSSKSISGGGTTAARRTSEATSSRSGDAPTSESSSGATMEAGKEKKLRIAGIAEQIMTARNIDSQKWESMSKPHKLRIIAAERKKEAEAVNTQHRDISELKRRLHKKKAGKKVFNLADMIKVQRQMDNQDDVIGRPTNLGLDSGYTSPSTGSPVGNSEAHVAEAAKGEEVKRTFLQQRYSREAEEKLVDKHHALLPLYTDVSSGEPPRQRVTEERTVVASGNRSQKQVVIKEGTEYGPGNPTVLVVSADVIASETGTEKTLRRSVERTSDQKVVTKDGVTVVSENDTVHPATSVINNSKETILISVDDKSDLEKIDERQKSENNEQSSDNKTAGESTSKFVGSVKKESKMADKEGGDKNEPERQKEKEGEEVPEKKEEDKPKPPEKQVEKEDTAKEPEKTRSPSPEAEKDETPSTEPEKDAPTETKSPEPEKDNDTPRNETEPENMETGEPEPQEQADKPTEDGDEDSEEDEEENSEIEAKKARQEKIESTISALDSLIDNQLNSVLGRPQTEDNGNSIPREKLDKLLNGEFSVALDKYLQGNSDGVDLMDKCLEVLG